MRNFHIIKIDKNKFLSFQKCRTKTFPNSLLHEVSNLRSIYFNQLNVPNEKLTLPDEFFRKNKRLEKLTIVDCNLEALPDSLICDSPYIQVIVVIIIIIIIIIIITDYIIIILVIK